MEEIKNFEESVIPSEQDAVKQRANPDGEVKNGTVSPVPNGSSESSEGLEGKSGLNAKGTNAYGQFKDAENLFQGYKNLLSEFTKRTQRLKETEERLIQIEKNSLWAGKIDELEKRYENAKNYRAEIKDYLGKNPDLVKEKDCLEKALLAVLTNGTGGGEGASSVSNTATAKTAATGGSNAPKAKAPDSNIFRQRTIETTPAASVYNTGKAVRSWVTPSSFSAPHGQSTTLPFGSTASESELTAPTPNLLGDSGKAPFGGYKKPSTVSEAAKLAEAILKKGD
ncbi:MAG: hypothetical protein LBN25_03560 [Christensenellaceae bacterium]|jgi:hypothetical protein|nr:hypothetical protein [Christensenellaceae bacterium]